MLPVYDKPLIHYPIATLFLANIREILIITTPEDQNAFIKLLGDGSQYGAQFQYATQEKPNGLAEAFLIGREFINEEPVALVLGDNIFYGVGLGHQLSSISCQDSAQIFAHEVSDPQNYGVIEFDEFGRIVSIEEKPNQPKSSFVIPGLYFFDSNVSDYASRVIPSKRGELEITTILQNYLEAGKLNVRILERGTAWLDTGTPGSLNDASNFVRVIEERSGLKIACLEEIAYNNKWIKKSDLKVFLDAQGSNDYIQYVRKILG
jgi:glucose-1-phosphate thymidylyltransferase